MRERDRVGGTDAKRAAAREVVHRACDEREPHVVEIAQRRRNDPWESAVDERFQQNGLEAIFAVVQRDQLVEDGLGCVRPRPPALDPCDLSSRASPERLLDQPLFRRSMKIESPRRDVCTARDVRHAQRVVAAPSDLA